MGDIFYLFPFPDLKVGASFILIRFSSNPERSEWRIEKTSTIGVLDTLCTRTPNKIRFSSNPERSEWRIEKTSTIGVLDTLRYSCSRYASLLEHRADLKQKNLRGILSPEGLSIKLRLTLLQIQHLLRLDYILSCHSIQRYHSIEIYSTC